MKSKLLFAFLSVALITTSCGGKKTGGPENPATSDEIELKLNLPKGKKYDMRLSMQSTGEMNMMGQQVTTTTNMNMGMDYEVMDINPAGNYVVRSTYRTIKMSGETMGMKYEYDSETEKANGMQAEEMSKSMKKMIGQYTEMEMDKGEWVKGKESALSVCAALRLRRLSGRRKRCWIVVALLLVAHARCCRNARSALVSSSPNAGNGITQKTSVMLAR